MANPSRMNPDRMMKTGTRMSLFRRELEERRQARERRGLNPPHRRSMNPHTQLFLDTRKRERQRYRVPVPVSRLKGGAMR